MCLYSARNLPQGTSFFYENCTLVTCKCATATDSCRTHPFRVTDGQRVGWECGPSDPVQGRLPQATDLAFSGACLAVEKPLNKDAELLLPGEQTQIDCT